MVTFRTKIRWSENFYPKVTNSFPSYEEVKSVAKINGYKIFIIAIIT